MTPEEKKAFEQQLADLKANLATETDAKAKKMIEDEIKSLESKLPTTEQVKLLQDEVNTLKANAEKNQKAIDDLIAKGNDVQVPAHMKTLADNIGDLLATKEAQLKAYKTGDGKGFSVTMDRKVMTSAANTTGNYFVTPTLVPGVVLQPYEEVHLRNILPVGQTNSNTIRYVRDMGPSDDNNRPGMVAEGDLKPEGKRDLQIFDAPVRKIATYFRVPEEMMDDIPYLQSFLSQIGVEEVMLLEDEEILYGDGTGQRLSGLEANSTAFSGTGLGIAGGSLPTPNHFDVLRAARTQARLMHRRPTVALVNPGDYYKMESTKDTTGNYMLLGGGNGIQPGRNVSGLTIIDHTAVEPDDFFVIDPRAAAIFDRTGLSVRFYDQDQDNAIRNLITIVIEKRLALPIYYETGIIFGTFTGAIADLDDQS